MLDFNNVSAVAFAPQSACSDKWAVLAERFSVIPLHSRSKRPIEPCWQRWCIEKRPYNQQDFVGRNVGIACGPASGVLVLDIDDAELFKASCKEKGWKIPETLTHQTGSNGQHYVFQYPQDGRRYGNKSFGKKSKRSYGFDLRGVGGQVVAPGSIHPETGKLYRVVKDIEPATCPDWVLALYDEPAPKPVPQTASPYCFDDDIGSLPVKPFTKDLIRNGAVIGARSEAIMKVLNALVWSRLSDPEIIGVFERYAIGEKYREKGQNRQKWLQPQIDKARAEVITFAVDRRGQSTTGSSGIASTDGDWGEPANVFDDFALGEPEWRSDYCPEVISEFAFDEAERMGVVPDQIAGPAIIALAGVLDDDFKLQPKRHDHTWVERPCLWGAVVGGSGTLKTPAKERADKPLKRLENKYYQEWKDEKERFDAALESSNGTAGMTLPGDPVRRRLYCKDTTIEGLREILRDGGGAKKILILADELSGILGSFDTYRQKSSGASKDRAYYLELYNGGGLPIDRAKKGEQIFVPNWSACLSGGITDDVLLQFFGKLDADGLLQRILLYRAKRIGPGIDRVPNHMAEKRYDETLNKLHMLQPGPKRTVIRLSEGSIAVREGFERLVALGYHLPGATPAFRAHLNKFSGMFCRLCLVYYLADAVSRGGSIHGPVDERIAVMAAKAMTDYHLPVARELYGRLGYTGGEDAIATAACGYILSKGCKAVAARDMVNGIREFRGAEKSVDKVRSIMDLLEAYNWVQPSRWSKKKPTAWAVNPLVYKKFERQAAAERTRRQEVRKKIKESIQTFGRQKNGDF